jgi:putative ABC transport system ATP-binding protein
MLKLVNVSKVFLTDTVETTAVNNVSLQIERGEFLAIMGPSGCGKSTLLSIIAMLDSPTSGEYFFLDKEIGKYSERQLAETRKRSIGIVYQNFNLIDDLTVFENVELPLRYQDVAFGERKKRTRETLQKLGIDHRSDHLPQQLSGGEQQRVAVARALVADCKLLLADEPTGNLDSANGVEVMNMLAEVNRSGTTVAIVTHSERDAKYAHRVAHMLDGRFVSQAGVAGVQVSP